MLNNEAIIERPDYKVHFRSYSDKLYGAFVIVHGEPHYIINEKLKGDMAIETLYRLIDASNEYAEYGFIMLQEGNTLFIDYDYKYSNGSKKFLHNTNVIDFNSYKYSLEYGKEKFKNRWDL